MADAADAKSLINLIERLSSGVQPEGRMCWCPDYKWPLFKSEHPAFCDEAWEVVQHARAHG